MFCSNCGVENNKDSKFCYNCGNKIEILNNNNQIKSGNQETSLVLGIFCLISSFFLNILCFIPGIISMIYAKKYKRESGKLGVGFGLSLGGMIFSVIILIITVLLFLFIFSVTKETIDSYDYNDNYGSYVDNLSKL